MPDTPITEDRQTIANPLGEQTNEQTGEQKRLLAINFGGIGDEVLFLPTLKACKKQFPNHHITLLLEPRSKGIFDLTNLVDAVITFDIKQKPLFAYHLLELVGLMREGNYDVVLSSGSSPMVAILLFLSGISERIGYNSTKLAPLLLSQARPLNRNQYAGSMYKDLSDKGHLVDAIPAIIVKEKSLRSMSAFLKEKLNMNGTGEKETSTISGTTGKRKLIAIHPGTSKLALEKGIIKTWPAQSWSELIQSLISTPDNHVILCGGPDDAESISEIEQALGQKSAKKNNFTNAYGITKSLSDLAAIIALSDLLICVDSAPMHIGVGLNKPLVALFGPTEPEKLLPEKPHFIALKAGHNAAAISATSVRKNAETLLSACSKAEALR